ncbi:hypothetical protein ElyMa_001555600 [Elysia marginata]|uniref:Uncharacterized protein n=1 Tax=Elysia marginata TaxID=1093978 RepID=A0AAV4JBZ9_9GAST|nr:hypothetical protein ElyMa_001555600 [Elysia marginata]
MWMKAPCHKAGQVDHHHDNARALNLKNLCTPAARKRFNSWVLHPSLRWSRLFFLLLSLVASGPRTRHLGSSSRYTTAIRQARTIASGHYPSQTLHSG